MNVGAYEGAMELWVYRVYINIYYGHIRAARNWKYYSQMLMLLHDPKIPSASGLHLISFAVPSDGVLRNRVASFSVDIPPLPENIKGYNPFLGI